MIAMRGYDLDGDSLVASLKTLPGSPSLLYQLSKVFSDYGYEPKMGTSISASVNVTGSQNRVLYKRPSIDSLPLGAWGIFTYTVSDADSTSLPGMITLVPPSGLIVASHFAQSAEGWKIVGNKAASSSALFESSSRGILNHFIYGSDDTINTDMAHGGDRSLWWFQAPEKFLGHQGISYGGSLDFVLSSFHGDFDAQNMNPGIFKSSGLHLVEMHCAKCNLNKGVTIAFPAAKASSFTGTAAAFSIALLETGGWLLDPKNTLVSWATPSKCEFIEVLSGLSSLKILGDFTKWYESVALDSVQLRNTRARIPICAQGTPDASTCTC